MPTVLVTGANRGLGLEFARQYSADGWDVTATVRHSGGELDALGVRIEPLDLAEAEAVASFAEKIEGPLDLFIANAATNHPMSTSGAENGRAWQAMMMTNAISPYQLGNALLGRMATNGKMIAISSGMGSIGENDGGWIPYRTSKAALNMAWSSLALDARTRGVTCVLFDPGWVKTRMGGSGAQITAEESVSALRASIDRLTIADSGRFLRRNGSQIPW